jgi:cyclophilin family peptidyl-prolyl cis-trans isomerase
LLSSLISNVCFFFHFFVQFYDPLTAKPRRIPLEILQEDESSKGFKLAYAGGFAKLPDNSKIQDNTPLAKPSTSRPYRAALTFDTPGLVALNHPDKYLNGGSSEFFSIPQKDLSKQKTRLVDGQYAPFGYITEGFNLLSTLKPGDIIASTDVSEFGYLSLIRVRGSTFGDIIQSSNDEEQEVGEQI